MHVQAAMGNLVICRMFSKVWAQLSAPSRNAKSKTEAQPLKVASGALPEEEASFDVLQGFSKSGVAVKIPSTLFEKCLGDRGLLSSFLSRKSSRKGRRQRQRISRRQGRRARSLLCSAFL